MNPQVDEFAKATVSLGGRCPLDCSHCYTTVPTFAHDSKRDVDEGLTLLQSFEDPIAIVCLSGDTDPFLRPMAAAEYLRRAAAQHPQAHLMYTTRLIPPPRVMRNLHDLGIELAQEDRLLVPAVSMVSATYPNEVENPSRVPSSAIRLGLLRDMSDGPQPVILALRPTFPFSVISRSEVASVIEQASDAADAILGEVFLLDAAGVIAERLGLEAALPSDEVAELTFLHQATVWRKRSFPAETRFAKARAAVAGVPYFTRSISAMRYFRRYWDLAKGESRHKSGDPVDLSAERIAP